MEPGEVDADFSGRILSVADMDLTAFAEDRKTYDAVERRLPAAVTALGRLQLSHEL